MVITIFTGEKKSTYAFFRQINVITKGLISREIFERNRGTAFYTHFWYMLLSRIFSNFHIVSERKFYNLPSLNIQTFSLGIFLFRNGKFKFKHNTTYFFQNLHVDDKTLSVEF